MLYIMKQRKSGKKLGTYYGLFWARYCGSFDVEFFVFNNAGKNGNKNH